MPISTGGVFFAGDWLMLIIITLAYYIFPVRVTGKKYEYIKFFLVFFSTYFLVCFLLKHIVFFDDRFLAVDPQAALRRTFLVFLFAALYVSHLLYRFKTVPKNKTLGFFFLYYL